MDPPYAHRPPDAAARAAGWGIGCEPMTLRRALILAILACEHMYAVSDAPGKSEFCDAARLIQALLDDARGPVDDWFMSAGHVRAGRGRHKSDY